MPSESWSHLKFTSCIAVTPSLRSNALDDGSRAHAGADAERHERRRQIAPLDLVEHGSEDHGARRTERMPHGDGAAVHIRLFVRDLEHLHKTKDDGCERFVE